MFSIREQKILDILKDGKSLSFSEISKKLFKKGELPMDANIVVGNTVRRIIKKCDYNKLDWSIEKSRKSFPMTVKICRK